MMWTYSAKGNGCPASGNGVTLTINRGCVTQSVGAITVNVVGTCVVLKYSYKWRFNSVITLLGPAAYPGGAGISSAPPPLNENLKAYVNTPPHKSPPNSPPALTGSWRYDYAWL